ncbi:hypothetical protein COW20_00715 [bacterium (Candidatus Blackallbacteria) CG13_big_fil_rev_8_21_14_2_50_49_14]|nr:MAG: hypothetical protein COW64_01705 [bacterium (Candidatus Blackallbacteria) CG18_big_fil_WC_8_21_14_2_50_49_26]PIW51027.1 MAG: hypothetical protein COW20_00715 [bacterium (Candidatus Blackallbacteria) CG13_big_fil_rev_8_21_14_2_50_49_14]
MPSISALRIGIHDTGLFDREDYIQIGRPLAKGVNAQQAAQLANSKPGAELVIRTTGAPELNHIYGEMLHFPHESYDVYQLRVVDRQGAPVPDKILNLSELISAVSFDKAIINRLENPVTGVIPAGLTVISSDQKFADLKFKGGTVAREDLYAIASASLGKISFAESRSKPNQAQ